MTTKATENDRSRAQTAREAQSSRRADRGWRTGTSREFLGLSDDEAAFVEIRLHLAKAMQAHRRKRRLTQVATARLLESSQSRVAKMEAGDPTVSVDLLVRSLLKLGATPAGIGRVFGKCG